MEEHTVSWGGVDDNDSSQADVAAKCGEGSTKEFQREQKGS